MFSKCNKVRTLFLWQKSLKNDSLVAAITGRVINSLARCPVYSQIYDQSFKNNLIFIKTDSETEYLEHKMTCQNEM